MMSPGFDCLSVVPSSSWALLRIVTVVRPASVVHKIALPQLPHFLQEPSFSSHHLNPIAVYHTRLRSSSYSHTALLLLQRYLVNTQRFPYVLVVPAWPGRSIANSSSLGACVAFSSIRASLESSQGDSIIGIWRPRSILCLVTSASKTGEAPWPLISTVTYHASPAVIDRPNR